MTITRRRLLESKIFANEEVMELLESQRAAQVDKGNFVEALGFANKLGLRALENEAYRKELKDLRRKS